MPQLKKGDPAPDFRAPDHNANPVGLADLDGRQRCIS